MNLTQEKVAVQSSSPIVRPLGAFEEFLWLFDRTSSMHFTLTAQVKGHTTVSEWRHALDRVQKRHPFFSVFIEKNGSEVANFRQGSAAAIPLRVVQGADVAKRWEFEVEQELAIPFDTGKAPLLRAVLLLEEQQAVFILVSQHSIADGRSFTLVIRDLLQALAGKPLDPLPVPPSVEELLGITSEFVPAKEAAAPVPSERPLGDVENDAHPKVRSLTLSTELTGKILKRAREEGTTVHGALSAALALAYWKINDQFSNKPVRVLSPIDLRKMLGLDDDCALLISAGLVAIEPDPAATFWRVASDSIAQLSLARTPEAVTAAKRNMHQFVKQGVDDAAAQATLRGEYAHNINLTNLGNLSYETDFGEVKLEAVWGPGVCPGTPGAHTIGAATTNGSLTLLQITREEPGSLLQTAEKILISACATGKDPLLSDLLR